MKLFSDNFFSCQLNFSQLNFTVEKEGLHQYSYGYWWWGGGWSSAYLTDVEQLLVKGGGLEIIIGSLRVGTQKKQKSYLYV